MSGLVVDLAQVRGRVERAWAAVSPFALSLREGAVASGILATGVVIACGGIRLSVASEYEIATAAGVWVPHLDPDWAIVIGSLLRAPLLIFGVLRAAVGCKALRWWWLSSPFVWRAMADDEFGFRLEMRPGRAIHFPVDPWAADLRGRSACEFGRDDMHLVRIAWRRRPGAFRRAVSHRCRVRPARTVLRAPGVYRGRHRGDDRGAQPPARRRIAFRGGVICALPFRCCA